MKYHISYKIEDIPGIIIIDSNKSDELSLKKEIKKKLRIKKKNVEIITKANIYCY